MASAFWIVVLGLVVLRSADVRKSLRTIGGLLLGPKLLVPFVIYAAWMVGIVALGARAGLWVPALAKDTLLWAIPGIGLVSAAVRASSEHRFFRHRLRQAVGVAVFLEFYLNLATFDIFPEIALQGIAGLAIGVSIVADRQKGGMPVKRLANGLLAIIGLAILVPPALRLINDW